MTPTTERRLIILAAIGLAISLSVPSHAAQPGPAKPVATQAAPSTKAAPVPVAPGAATPSTDARKAAVLPLILALFPR